MVDALGADPEQDEGQLAAALARRNIKFDGTSLHQRFIEARHEAIERRVARALENADLTVEQVEQQILKSPDLSPLKPVVEQAYSTAVVARSMRRFGIPPPPGYPLPTPTELNVRGIAPLYAGAMGVAAVDYPSMDDGTIRCVPLFMEYQGLLYPHMGLALACAMSGADLHGMHLERNVVVIPRRSGAGGDLRIQIRPPRTDRDGNRFTALIDVPWFGGGDWKTMYDPARRETVQQFSIVKLYDILETRRRIEANLVTAEQALRPLLAFSQPDELKALDARRPEPGDISPERAALPRKVLAELAPLLAPGLNASPERLDKTELIVQDAFRQLKGAV
jgi:hypothetical protein